MRASDRSRAARAACVITFASLAAASALQPAAAQLRVDERFPVSTGALVKIHSLAGTVRVTGWDRDTVVVRGTVYEPANGEWILEGNAQGVRLSLWSSDADPKVEPSTLEVQVPRSAQVWVKTSSADIAVRGLTGRLDLNSVTGAITVAGTPEEVFAETIGGALAIDATARVVRARTASGDLRIRGNVREVTAHTVSGELTVEGDGFERGVFESIDSDIRYLGTVGPRSVLDFKNHAGAIELVLPADASGDFAVSTYSGRFSDGFGANVRSVPGKPGRELRFTLGSGGGQVSVLNFKGAVILRRRD